MAAKQALKNVIFLYNPVSGDASAVEFLDKVTMHYQRAGYALTLFRITREKGLSKLAELIDSIQPEHLLAAGGDGTINRLVNYLKRRDKMVPIAILPMGTANDFARLIGMPDRLGDACKAILNGRLEHLDLGRVNDRYFVNIFSSGIFTDISQKTPTIWKNSFGKLAYYVSGLSELHSFKKMNISVKSQECSYRGTCLLLLVFNGRTAGNIKMAGHSEVNDGLLDVLIIKGDHLVESIKMALHVLVKRESGEYSNDIIYFQTQKLAIESDSPTTDIDGEEGPVFPLEIECLKGELPIIVPPYFPGEEPQKKKRKSIVRRKF